MQRWRILLGVLAWRNPSPQSGNYLLACSTTCCAWQGGAHAAGGGHLVRHGRGCHCGAGPLLQAVEPGHRRALLLLPMQASRMLLSAAVTPCL